VVGVTDQCDDPPQARSLPKVGGMVKPDWESVVRLRPDLVVASTSGNDASLVSQSEGLGLPLYFILTPFPGTVTHQKVKDQIFLHDYDYYDLLHTVLPTKMPLRDFYASYSKLYGAIALTLAMVLGSLLNLYWWIVFVAVLITWVNPDPYNPVVRFLRGVTEPVFYQVRRRLPLEPPLSAVINRRSVSG
jgi:hypothetical protein